MGPYRMMDLKHREERREEWKEIEQERLRSLKAWEQDEAEKRVRFEELVEKIADRAPREEVLKLGEEFGLLKQESAMVYGMALREQRDKRRMAGGERRKLRTVVDDTKKGFVEAVQVGQDPTPAAA